MGVIPSAGSNDSLYSSTEFFSTAAVSVEGDPIVISVDNALYPDSTRAIPTESHHLPSKVMLCSLDIN